MNAELPHWFGNNVDREWFARHAFAARVHARWSAGIGKADHPAPGSVAVDIRRVDSEGADFVGRYLARATYDAATKMGIEMTSGQTSKEARNQRNRTPFEILAELAASVDARGVGVRTPRHWAVVDAGQGDWAVIDKDTEWSVWHEWEEASKGRRQVFWSRKRRNPVSRREEVWNNIFGSTRSDGRTVG